MRSSVPPELLNNLTNISDSSGESPTPNMDTFAKEGIRFTDYHSPYAVCTPSRASLLTARLGARTGLYRLGFFSSKFIPRVNSPLLIFTVWRDEYEGLAK